MILISTKLKTTNIGNQALSDELIDLSALLLKEKKQYMVTGRPTGLDKYTIRDLDPNNLIDDFEKNALKIFTLTKTVKPNSSMINAPIHHTNLLDVQGTVVKTEKIRKMARKVRKLVRSINTYSHDYKKRLSLYKGAEYYLYSAAGEISEEDFFYRQLLDLRVAQLMGVKVCAINQSVELPQGPYKILLGYVYSKMYKVVVRGEISRNDLKNLGVNSAIISVAPDTAFLTRIKEKKRIPTIQKIGINFTKKTYNSRQVDPFIHSLIDSGYSLSFVTNDPFGDESVAKEFRRKFNMPEDLETRDYKKFSAGLQEFDLIISSRLHTNELALVANVPILPIEGNLHKTTEVFEFINYPIRSINYKSSDYGNDLQSGFDEITNTYSDIQSWIEHNITLVAQEAKKNLTMIVE